MYTCPGHTTRTGQTQDAPRVCVGQAKPGALVLPPDNRYLPKTHGDCRDGQQDSQDSQAMGFMELTFQKG